MAQEQSREVTVDSEPILPSVISVIHLDIYCGVMQTALQIISFLSTLIIIVSFSLFPIVRYSF